MVYRRFHCEKADICDDEDCKPLTAYVRIEGKWEKIGYYGSVCKQFSHLDLQKEEEDRQLKLRLLQFKSDIQQTKNGNYDLNS
jgi:hypothetical protein